MLDDGENKVLKGKKMPMNGLIKPRLLLLFVCLFVCLQLFFVVVILLAYNWDPSRQSLYSGFPTK